MRKNGTELACPVCGKKRYWNLAQLRQGRGRYCSRKCSAVDIAKKRLKGTTIHCIICGKPKYWAACFLKQGGGHYCSRLCAQKGMHLLGKNSGQRNPRWSGGKSYYKNHYTLKKNRLIKLQQTEGICEICRKNPARNVFHNDGNRDNHNIENLTVACIKCWAVLTLSDRATKTSKYIRLYGMTGKQIAEKHNINLNIVYHLHYAGKLSNFLENPEEFYCETASNYRKIGTKYTRLYGMTVTEIAKKLHYPVSRCYRLHTADKLAEALEKVGYPIRPRAVVKSSHNYSKPKLLGK